jgi:hypothetical protein
MNQEDPRIPILPARRSIPTHHRPGDTARSPRTSQNLPNTYKLTPKYKTNSCEMKMEMAMTRIQGNDGTAPSARSSTHDALLHAQIHCNSSDRQTRQSPVRRTPHNQENIGSENVSPSPPRCHTTHVPYPTILIPRSLSHEALQHQRISYTYSGRRTKQSPAIWRRWMLDNEDVGSKAHSGKLRFSEVWHRSLAGCRG